MEITERQEGEVQVLGLNGRFDAQSAGSVEESLKAQIEGGAKKILVDMSGVEYVSSAGLRVLLSSAKRTAAQGGSLVLCGLKSYVWEVFEVAGFTTIFQIFPDTEEGLKNI